jgi:hypothetical protein
VLTPVVMTIELSSSSIPTRANGFVLLHNIKAAAGIHPASYQISTGSSFRKGKQFTYYHLVSRLRIL